MTIFELLLYFGCFQLCELFYLALVTVYLGFNGWRFCCLTCGLFVSSGWCAIYETAGFCWFALNGS